MKFRSKLVIMMIVALLFSTTGIMEVSAYANTTKASELVLGDYVVLGEYNGSPILWKVLDNNDKGVYMISDKVISFKPFAGRGAADGQDAKTGALNTLNEKNDRETYGDARWSFSSLRVWLNSAENTVDYRNSVIPSKENLDGVTARNPETGRNFHATNAYDEEAGFLSGFSSHEIEAINTVKNTVLLSEFDKNYADTGSEIVNGFISSSPIVNGFGPGVVFGDFSNTYRQLVEDKVFCPSIEEIRNYVYLKGVDGLAYPTQEAFDANESYSKTESDVSDPVNYWLRTPDFSFSSISNVMIIVKNHVEGSTVDYKVTSALPSLSADKPTNTVVSNLVGVRPAVYLNKGTSLSGSGSVSNPYKVKEIFIDVSGISSWAEDEVLEAYDYGLTTTRVLSDYQNNMTREEFCEIIMKLYYNLGGEKPGTSNNPFVDTNNIDVIEAKNIGIINGTSLDTFSPNNSITREQMCVMLYNTIKKANVSHNSDIMWNQNFNDESEISSWAYDSVKFINGYKIVLGSNDEVSPLNNVTREQGIMLLKRTYNVFK